MSQNTDNLLKDLNDYLQSYGIDENGDKIEKDPVPPIIDRLAIGINPSKSGFLIQLDGELTLFSIPGCQILEGGANLTPSVINRINAFYKKNESILNEELFNRQFLDPEKRN